MPCEHVLCEDDGCEKASVEKKGLGRVLADTQIDRLFGYLSTHEKGVIVENEDGSVVGIATARTVLAALALGSSSKPAIVKSKK